MRIKSLFVGLAAVLIATASFAGRGSDGNVSIISVSYTHLTLPTIVGV